jgi:hypothetical protein
LISEVREGPSLITGQKEELNEEPTTPQAITPTPKKRRSTKKDQDGAGEGNGMSSKKQKLVTPAKAVRVK